MRGNHLFVFGLASKKEAIGSSDVLFANHSASPFY